MVSRTAAWLTILPVLSLVLPAFFNGDLVEVRKQYEAKREDATVTVQTPSPVQATTNNIIIDHEEMCPSIPPKRLLIVAGAQKAGTSAIWTILRNKHPQFQVNWKRWPGTRESHFFTKIIHQEQRSGVPNERRLFTKESLHGNISSQVICDLRAQYHSQWKLKPIYRDFNQTGIEIVPLEKTPNYMCSPYVPSLIKKVAPLAKVVIALRDPTARAFSAYKHFFGKQRGKGQIKFPHMINQQVKALRDMGLSKAPLLNEHYNASTTPDSAFDLPPNQSLSNLQSLPHYHGILCKGFYAQQLVPWLKHFQLGRDILVVSYDDISNNPQHVMQQVQTIAGVQVKQIRQEAFDLNYHNRKSKKIVLTPAEKRYLQQFYRPYNQQLQELLGTSWKGIWTNN